MLFAYFPTWNVSPEATACGGIALQSDCFAAYQAPAMLQGRGVGVSLFFPFSISSYYVTSACGVYKAFGFYFLYESFENLYSEGRAGITLSPLKGPLKIGISPAFLWEYAGGDVGVFRKGCCVNLQAFYKFKKAVFSFKVFNLLFIGFPYTLLPEYEASAAFLFDQWGILACTTLKPRLGESSYFFRLRMGAYVLLGPLKLMAGLNGKFPAFGIKLRLGSFVLAYSLDSAILPTHKISLEVRI